MKKISFIALAIAVLIMFASCSGNKPVARHMPEEGATTYKISGTLDVQNGDNVTVVFESDLLTGTIVEVGIYAYDGEKLYTEKYSITGKTVKFEIEKEASWSGKEVYVSVVASPSTGRQPNEVRDTYGRLFENIESEDLIWDKAENILLFQSDKIKL